MKSTFVNVACVVMMCSILSSCSTPALQVDNVQNSVPTFNPQAPAEIKTAPVTWQVIDSSKLNTLCKAPSANFMMYGVTPQGFENNLLNLQDADRYIEQQNVNLQFYKNYNDSLSTPVSTPTPLTNKK